ncbi:unnamed protein product [Polarella glacialis]|uniref:Uncharacterized protein n=1 Tax=Polarella glacialis TaxID=89957 RepID=A0A813ENB2_POLGL|nr:unnamed protein product [Polarella glacialis]
MAPRRLTDSSAEEPPKKRQKTAAKAKAKAKAKQLPPPSPAKAPPAPPPAEAAAAVPKASSEALAVVSRGGGRGLKAVQNSREQSSTVEAPDGSRTEAKMSIKEQKLFSARGNAHVETKVMSEQNKRTTRKDGTVIITESKSTKKVCYL